MTNPDHTSSFTSFQSGGRFAVSQHHLQPSNMSSQVLSDKQFVCIVEIENQDRLSYCFLFLFRRPQQKQSTDLTIKTSLLETLSWPKIRTLARYSPSPALFNQSNILVNLFIITRLDQDQDQTRGQRRDTIRFMSEELQLKYFREKSDFCCEK